MSHRLSERVKMFNEVLTISSAAGATSQRYYMGDAYKITFCCGGGTAAASTAQVLTFTVNQHPDEAGATSTTIAGATATIGSTLANNINAVKNALITFTTASTLTETVTIGIGGGSYAMTYVGQSTLVTTVATALAFGSSVGSTNAGGLDAVANSFSSVVNNSTLSRWLTATTVSTAAVRLTVNDSAVSTGFSALTTGTNIAPSVVQSGAIIEVLAEDMNATSQYVSIACSSGTTTQQIAVCVMKSGMRQQPPTQVGQQVKTT